MTDLFHSVLLAQIMGLYMVITAILLISRRKLFIELVNSVTKPNIAIMARNFFNLMIGLSLLATHNIWEFKPRILITIASWFILVKALFWLGLPERMITLSKKMSATPAYYLYALIIAVAGIVLLAKGYYPHIDANPLN